MTHEAWDVPARQAFRELEAWSHKWRGIDGGDGARLAGMLARLLVRVVPREKLASLRYALNVLLDEHSRRQAELAAAADSGEQADRLWAEFAEIMQASAGRPAGVTVSPEPARVVRPPWRCRWLGHDWRAGLPELGGPVFYCGRAGCVEELGRQTRTRGVIVGVAGAAVPAGGLVTVTLDGKVVAAKDAGS